MAGWWRSIRGNGGEQRLSLYAFLCWGWESLSVALCACAFVCICLCLSAFARLRFLRGAHRKGRHGLCIMTDAKHAHAKRAREREGAIPRKRPRVSAAHAVRFLRPSREARRA